MIIKNFRPEFLSMNTTAPERQLQKSPATLHSAQLTPRGFYAPPNLHLQSKLALDSLNLLRTAMLASVSNVAHISSESSWKS